MDRGRWRKRVIMKKKKVKVFLSLGFKGRSRDEVLDKIQKMKDYINKNKTENVEYEFYHNYYCSLPLESYESYDVKHKSIYYLGVALNMLSKCDMMLLNFEDINDHDGVATELNVAMRYNIPLMMYNENNYMVFVE